MSRCLGCNGGSSYCSNLCPYRVVQTIAKCEHCGLDITKDDEYLSYYHGKYYHADCLTDMNGEEIAEMLGMQIERGK